jgi:hypothetical protein
MSDLSPLDAVADPKLGRVLRMALDRPHDGAFVARVRARLGRADRGWDEVLAGWFWQGLAAASLVAAFAAGWAMMSTGATAGEVQESMAVQLLDGGSPGSDLLLTSLAGNR